MPPLGPRKSHYWKLQSMLHGTRSDAAAAFEAGDISSDEWAQMVERCRGCSDPSKCARVLRQLGLMNEAGEAPDFCANKQRIADLHIRFPEVA